MRFSEKVQSIMSGVEVILAGIMFFVMLISCGMYINIKLNGKVSNLPPLSENDTRMILRSSGVSDDDYSGTLLEPLFVGIKSGDKMTAVMPQYEVRKSVENRISEALSVLFEGTYKTVSFDSEHDLSNYIEKKKYSSDYMLLGFYNDLPSSVVLPCVVDNYRDESLHEVFLFKYIFLLPDKKGNLYASAISESGEVTELFPGQEIRFDKIVNDSYDVSDGWTKFDYSELKALYPVFTSSLVIGNCSVASFAESFGVDSDRKWIDELFEIFSINENLVRSFVSGNGSVVNHVEESGELVIRNDGTVSYKASENYGISLNEFLGYISDTGTKLSLSDKLFALKIIINSTIQEDELSCSIVGININETDGATKVYFKYLHNGVFLYPSAFDAAFEIKNDYIINADFKMMKLTSLDTYAVVSPQKYASVAASSEVNLFYDYNSDTDNFSAVWGCSSEETSEVKNNGN